MFAVQCMYRPSVDGLTFWPHDPETDENPCELQVTFEPISYYPPEPDIGAGHDYDACVASIELRDDSLPVNVLTGEVPLKKLTGNDLHNAHAFLGRHYSEQMWAQAEKETLEAFGVDTGRCAA